MLSIGTLPCQDAFRKTGQDAFTLNKTPRPARRFQMARFLVKTRSEKHDKTHSLITRRQDLQDAFKWHAPLSRRVHKKKKKTHSHLTRCQDLQDAFDRHAPLSRRLRKTRQDAFVHSNTPRPSRCIRKARSLVKTRSEKHDKTHSLIRTL